jgi:CRISPR-associated protein Csh2
VKNQEVKQVEVETNGVKRADLLILWTSRNCIVNGDPWTGEQRYDEATGRPLCSDVRLKAFARWYADHIHLFEPGHPALDVFFKDFTQSDIALARAEKEGASGASVRVRMLKAKYKPEEDLKTLVLKCLDSRGFGNVVTEKKTPVHLTGPIQFEQLNPTLHQVKLMENQNTCHLPSDIKNNAGAIATSSLVPFSINQVVGGVYSILALETGLTEDDVILILRCLWRGINCYKSRSKMGQNSRLILKINYQDLATATADLNTLVTLKNSEDKGLRRIDQAVWDFSRLDNLMKDPNVVTVEYRADSFMKPVLLGAISKDTVSKMVELQGLW